MSSSNKIVPQSQLQEINPQPKNNASQIIEFQQEWIQSYDMLNLSHQHINPNNKLMPKNMKRFNIATKYFEGKENSSMLLLLRNFQSNSTFALTHFCTLLPDQREVFQKKMGQIEKDLQSKLDKNVVEIRSHISIINQKVKDVIFEASKFLKVVAFLFFQLFFFDDMKDIITLTTTLLLCLGRLITIKSQASTAESYLQNAVFAIYLTVGLALILRYLLECYLNRNEHVIQIQQITEQPNLVPNQYYLSQTRLTIIENIFQKSRMQVEEIVRWENYVEKAYSELSVTDRTLFRQRLAKQKQNVYTSQSVDPHLFLQSIQSKINKIDNHNCRLGRLHKEIIQLSRATFRLKDIYSTLNSALLLYGKHQTQDDKIRNNKQQGDKAFQDNINYNVAAIYIGYVILGIILNIIFRVLRGRKERQRRFFEQNAQIMKASTEFRRSLYKQTQLIEEVYDL